LLEEAVLREDRRLHSSLNKEFGSNRRRCLHV
jgi:hypothetical protein